MVRDDMALQDYSQYEWPHDKTNKMACVPSEDPDQPGHPPSLIRVFAFRMKKAWVLSYPLSAQGRLIRLGCQSLHWVHMPFSYTPPPHTQKVAGYYVIPSKNLEFPSVSTSFPDSSLSRFDRFSSNFAWTLILELQMG